MAVPYDKWKCPHCEDVEKGYYLVVTDCIRYDYYTPSGECDCTETEDTPESDEIAYCSACNTQVIINWVVE